MGNGTPPPPGQRQGFTPDEEVLDAGSGSRNLTIPTARTGAAVTGLEHLLVLLDVTERWGRREGLSSGLDVGNVESVQEAAQQFEVVLSMVGLMSAARPDLVMAELARVTCPGDRVALANWTRGGHIGALFTIHAAHRKPAGDVPSPLLWCD